MILLVDMQKKEDILQTLRTLYQSTNKYWVYLANLTIQTSPKELGVFLQAITEELHRLPFNNSFRIFLIGLTQDQGAHFFYNKFEISRFKCNHHLSDDDYYHAINRMTLDSLTVGTVKKKPKGGNSNACNGGNDRNLGVLLMEQLIVSTIN